MAARLPPFGITMTVVPFQGFAEYTENLALVFRKKILPLPEDKNRLKRVGKNNNRKCRGAGDVAQW